ncbi:MAG TPA: hypothetical protein VG797_05145 [Phycisphaerales bacterium]|nr:hypothetical protein [Phycisphaerales bacterium]
MVAAELVDRAEEGGRGAAGFGGGGVAVGDGVGEGRDGLGVVVVRERAGAVGLDAGAAGEGFDDFGVREPGVEGAEGCAVR